MLHRVKRVVVALSMVFICFDYNLFAQTTLPKETVKVEKLFSGQISGFPTGVYFSEDPKQPDISVITQQEIGIFEENGKVKGKKGLHGPDLKPSDVVSNHVFTSRNNKWVGVGGARPDLGSKLHFILLDPKGQKHGEFDVTEHSRNGFLSDDGNLLVTTGKFVPDAAYKGGYIFFYDRMGRETVVSQDDRILFINKGAFSESGEWVALAAEAYFEGKDPSATYLLFFNRQGNELWRKKLEVQGGVLGLLMSGNGKTLVAIVSGAEPTALIYDRQGNLVAKFSQQIPEKLKSYAPTFFSHALSSDPEGRYLALCFGSTLLLVETSTGKLVFKKDFQPFPLWAVGVGAVAPNGKYILVAENKTGFDNTKGPPTFWLLDKSGEPIWSYVIPGEPLANASFDQGGKRFFIAYTYSQHPDEGNSTIEVYKISERKGK